MQSEKQSLEQSLEGSGD